MSSSGGWMTTKKQGRDDKAIQAAKKTALEKRMTKRGLPPAKPKKSAKRNKGFVADSESEESQFSIQEDPESDEEDFVLPEEESSDDNAANDSDDDDDDDGPTISFMKVPKGKRTKFTVKPMVEEAAKLKRKGKANGYRAKAQPKVVDSDEENWSGAESDIFPNQGKKSTAAAKKKKKKSDSLGSSEEEIDSPLPPSNNGKKSKYFAPNDTTVHSLSSDDDDTPAKPTNEKQAWRKRVIAMDEDDSDDQVVLLPSKPKKNSKKKSNGSSSWLAAENTDADDSVDDDEAMALAEAIKNSLKDGKKSKKGTGKKRFQKFGKKINNGKSNKTTKKTKEHEDDFLKDSDEEDATEMLEGFKEEKPIEVMEVPSSDDDEDELDDQDAYMDDDAKEASTVLAAANELSASVLRVMTSWASDLDEGGDMERAKMTVPQGMIVDGALAMASLKKNPSEANNKSGNNSSSHSWISNEVMQKVLPNLTLAEYQLIGVNWMAMLHKMTYTTNGKATNVNGILADEMGLGKTCQTIAFLAWLKHTRRSGASNDEEQRLMNRNHDKGNDLSEHEASEEEKEPEVFDVDKSPSPKERQSAAEVSMRRTDEESSPDARLPHLIVVPASVVSNWEREFQTFAPDMRVVKYHGTLEERSEMKHKLRACLRKQKGAPEVDVILASISYFQKESSEDRQFLGKFKYDYLVVDEGHLLKNAKGLRYKNLDRFRTLHRLLLTGTPVQNSPQELMALLCFLMPLFSRKTSNEFEEEETYKGEGMLQHFVSLEENAANEHVSSHEFAYRKLKQLFAPFVLRRRKNDVLRQILPPKTYQVEMVTLDEKARSQYNSIIDAHVRAKKSKTMRFSDHLFTNLRKAAHHPLLLRHRHTSKSEIVHLSECFRQFGAFPGDGATKERVEQELEGFSDFEIHLTAHELLDQNPLRSDKLARYILSNADLFASGKFVRLREILPKLVNDGHRILIFSGWTRCLDLLGCLMEELELDYRRMDGQTPVAERQERIDEFNNSPAIPVFLLSTRACGMGINLTAADVCIMHDIDMNPFSDHQAEARCHRIGQSKPVKIIKLIAQDTVDSAIYEMQERKVRMNAAIMESPSEWTKEEKKEKALILQTVVDRHAKAGVERVNAGKENAANTVIEISDENEECQL